MRHLNNSALLNTQQATSGNPAVRQEIPVLSGGCIKGKQTIEAFPWQSDSKATFLLELVHTDKMGPIQKLPKGGVKYTIFFGDDYSRYAVALF